MKQIYWIGLWILTGLCQPLVAQENMSKLIWAEKLFDRSKGLKDKPVNQVFEDSRGFFWLVTDDNLLFFDGREFRPVMSHGSPERLQEVRIRCEDAEGRIWVRYRDSNGLGFRLFDMYDRSRVNEPLFFPKGIALSLVRDVTVDEKGDFFILTFEGELWRHSWEERFWHLEATCISADFSFAFSENISQDLWLTSKAKKGESNRVLAHWTLNQLDYFDIKDLVHFAQLESGGLICVTKKKLGLLHENGDFENRDLRTLFPGFDFGREDIRSYNSTFGYNKHTGDVFLLYHGELELSNWRTGQPYISSKRPFVQSAYTGIFGRGNSIWFGTLEGVKQLEFQVNSFERIQWSDPSRNQFSHRYSVRGIAACPDGQIFFSANDYLWRYDPLSKRTDQLLFINNGTSDVIWDSVNRLIWVVGNKALIGYDPSKKIYDTYSSYDVAGSGYTFGLYSMGDSVFIPNSTGGSAFSILTNKESKRFTAYGDFPDFETAEVYGFFEYSSSTLFIYSNQGIYLWEKGGGITARYSTFGEGEYYIPALNIRHIHRDENGVIWLASREGLVRWEPDLRIAELYTEKDRLYDSNLYGIFEDDHGFLWLSSNYGIIQYHKATGVSRVFTEDHGISHNEFNRVAHEQDAEGTIYFGSLNGITRFHPNDFVFDPGNLAAPEIELISLSLFDRKKDVQVERTGAFFADRPIEILPSETNLYASFAVNNHDITERLSYSYRLLDTERSKWVELTSSALQIPKLPYGKYDIEVRVRDADLDFGDSYLRIPVEVLLPLHLRPWFILLGASVFLAVLFWGVTREIRQRDRQNSVLRELVEQSTAEIAADKRLIEAQAADLQRKNLEKDRFFASVSHEFRTPIALILGPTEVLQESLKPSSREFSLLQTIKNNALGLLKLINDILMLSKLEYSELSPKLEVLDLNMIVNELSEEFDPLFERKNIIFNKHYRESQITWISSDKQFLKIILQNLLSNALKFTASHREVKLVVGVKGNNILIEVEDEGRGIHPDDLPHVFERYYQGFEGSERLEGGTGIGLSLVQELVSALGGKVGVSSEWGKGTKFSVELPLRNASEPASVSKRNHAVVSYEQYFNKLLPFQLRSQLEGRHVLLVEDNPYFYDYIKQVLGNFFDVKYARSGKEALILLKGRLQPIMILTDLMMPEMDGLELLARLKSSPEFRDIPVVAITARAEDQTKIDAFSLGVNDYLLKPFSALQLISVVAHLLERQFNVNLVRQSEQELANSDQETSAWLLELKQVIEKGIESVDFSVEKLMIGLPISRSVFFNKVKSITGLTPNQLIMEIRLQKARAYFTENPQLTNKQVMKLIGLKHESYFIRVFTRRFGYSPGQMKS